MCGLVGVLSSREPPEADTLARMARRLAHRGPDGEGVFVEGQVGLGHRRLAILDPTPAGAQPMHSHDGRCVLVFNGCVYNFRELGEELKREGVRLRTRSDTEVVLEALRLWGTQAIERFNGMFALAFWDRSAQQLLLARDRYGQKPLYLARTSAGLLFASEVKALAAHPSFTPAINGAALVEYLTFQNFFGAQTLFDGVQMLPPGHHLRIDASGRERLDQYWDFTFEEPTHQRTDDDLLEELTDAIERAVKRQLVSDVDVGTYLSGGLDSGTVTALAARHLPWIRSFTCGFDLTSASGLELSFDERPLAERMSYLFKTEHYEMVLKSGDMERVLPRLAKHIEEPRVGQSYPNFYAAQLAGRFVKVVLAGTGGDELFGGYPWRYHRASHAESYDAFADLYYSYWQRILRDEEIAAVCAPLDGARRGPTPQERFHDVFKHQDKAVTREEDAINLSLYFESKTFLHGLLVVEDKLSMAHGLETRLPFLDNELVAIACRLPMRLKVRASARGAIDENELAKTRRSTDGKIGLRAAVKKWLPEDVASGAKQGFSAPDASWFRGESIDYVRRRLFDERSPLYDYVDQSAVHTVINDHLIGRENRRLAVWAFLSLDAFVHQHLLGESGDLGAPGRVEPA